MTNAMRRSRSPWRRMLAVLVLAFVVPTCLAQTLVRAQDLRADGELAAGRGAPLIVLVSLEGCPHCEVVRRSHLLPLGRGEDRGSSPVIRQIELRGNAALVDFNGERKTHAAFARERGAAIAPVVMFLGSKGQTLAPPLIGAMIPDFYGAYFDAALVEARARIAGNRQGTGASP